MRVPLVLLALAGIGCSNSSSQHPSDTTAIADAPAANEIAQWRGASQPDSIDALLARVLATDGEFFEGDTDVPSYSFTLRNDSAFKRLSQWPGALPRLVECLAKDRHAAAKWGGSRVLVGAVCGQALIISPYAERRSRLNTWPRGFQESSWTDYRSTIEKLRAAQKVWRRQLSNDPA